MLHSFGYWQQTLSDKVQIREKLILLSHFLRASLKKAAYVNSIMFNTFKQKHLNWKSASLFLSALFICSLYLIAERLNGVEEAQKILEHDFRDGGTYKKVSRLTRAFG